MAYLWGNRPEAAFWWADGGNQNSYVDPFMTAETLDNPTTHDEITAPPVKMFAAEFHSVSYGETGKDAAS